MLKGKHILIGVTGSIAAYKTAYLVRALIKEGAQVKIIMTEMAKQFITPLTLATLSKSPILVDFYNPENGDWNSHVSLGLWSDLYLIAPASANTIAKMATGIADNLLLTTYLSARCPVVVAPAMDVDMFQHDATQSNLAVLKERGVTVIEPAEGELASGLEGKGRMEEPDKIVFKIKGLFPLVGPLSGKRVLITAGPTREELDPVRYITNYSTGKMGYELANAFSSLGANVTVVSGPVNITPNTPHVVVEKVTSALQMYEKTTSLYSQGVDIVVLCAAVADYTPDSRSCVKMKKEGNEMSLKLVTTKDIAAQLGAVKRDNILHVGFALETDNALQNAKDKLKRKNLDMIVLNSLQDEGAGFATDTNKVTILLKDGTQKAFSLKSKSQVAADIVENIQILLQCSNA